MKYIFLLVIAYACSEEAVEITIEDEASNDSQETTNNEQENLGQQESETEEIDAQEESESDSDPEVVEEEELEPPEPENELSCETGLEFLEICTGDSIAPIPECTPDLHQELELIQYLTCETFLNTKETLPLCTSMGLNCPEDYQGCSTEQMTAADMLSVLQLTENSSLTTIDQVAERNASLRSIFADHGDYRGTFASVYSPITNLAVDAIEAETFVHDQWVRDLVIEFSSRYYENLRASMLQQPNTQSWNRYYELSDDCSVSGLRIGAFGIVVHLMVDLPHTLVSIDTSEVHKDDFDLFGLTLVEATPLVIQNLQDDYEIDAENFFNGFFLGEWIDSVQGEDTTTTFAFQTIRNKAWTNAMWLQGWQSPIANAEIYTSWRTADGALATWDIVQ